MRLFGRAPYPVPPASVEIGGREVALRVRRNPRARHVVLRIDRGGSGLVLTLPEGTALTQGLDLIRKKTAWISGHLDKAADRSYSAFADGTALEVLGETLTIRHLPGTRMAARRAGGAIEVGGRAEHLARRIRDWLRAEAERFAAARAAAHASTLGVTIGRIVMRDTRSRWGSCSAKGDLSLCWRLALAPPWVFDYVIAHEVAHRRAMNHGPAFWAAVSELIADPAPARAWLRRHGPELHRSF